MAADTEPTAAGLAASLDITLGKLAGKIDDYLSRQPRPGEMWQYLRPVPILPGSIPLAAGAGTLDAPGLLGPRDGFWWDVRRLSAWGFTAGTVNVYLNDATGSGELVAAYTSAGQFTWSAHLLLGPLDRLVAVASGITGTVTLAGQAIEVSAQKLPDYLI